MTAIAQSLGENCSTRGEVAILDYTTRDVLFQMSL